MEITHRVELDPAGQDAVRHSTRIRERRHILSNAIERQRQLLRDRSAKLGLALVSHNHDGILGVSGFVLLDGSAGGFGDGGVDTAAETLVGGDDDVELFAAIFRGGFGLLEHLCKRMRRKASSVCAGI